MPILGTDRVKVPEDVLISGLQNESVLLNLQSEAYFGLDEVGTRMFKVLTSSDSIETAINKLVGEYDIEPERLRRDVLALVNQLIENGLVAIAHD